MPKRIIAQRRGRGTPRYRAHSHRHKGKAKYVPGAQSGKIVDLVKCIGHSAPLAKVLFNNGVVGLMIAGEKIAVGDVVSCGDSASVSGGNVLPLKNIPDGTLVFNIESNPGDGGKFARAGGSFARVVSRVDDKVSVLFPSKKQKVLLGDCRATIGVVAGGGRLEKPFVKAGTRHHLMMRRGRLYPVTSAVAMNAVDHPFGSGRGRHVGKTKIAPRNAPSGRKVGLVRPRRTGKRR